MNVRRHDREMCSVLGLLSSAVPQFLEGGTVGESNAKDD